MCSGRADQIGDEAVEDQAEMKQHGDRAQGNPDQAYGGVTVGQRAMASCRAT